LASVENTFGGSSLEREPPPKKCNFFVVLFLSLSLSLSTSAAVSLLNEKMRSFDDDEDTDDSDDSEGEFADEGDWYASLIAGEQVGEWLDVIEEETKQRRNEEEEEEEEGRRNRRRTKNDDANGRFRSAIEQLTKHVEEDEVYGEEAEVAEAERILSEALAKVSLTTNIDDDDEEIEKETSSSSSVRKLLRQSLEAIETHRKRKKNVKTYAMKNGRVEVSILETKLSNGVGGKLWKAALLLAEQLDDKEGEPKDDDDDDDGVIIDVKDKTVLELGAGVGLVGFAAAKLGAKEVVLSDFEAPLLEALAESVERNGSEKTTKVRWLDWRADGASNTEKTEPPDAFLALEKEDTYDIILGSDCLYESHHATLLPKVINKRLSSSPNARCRLLGAVRNREMLDQLIENFRKCENLRATETSVAKSERLNYDGGYVRVDIKRKSF
jgi:ribosomal protein L11 methylase PrmA